jgi:hypothetical protein
MTAASSRRPDPHLHCNRIVVADARESPPDPAVHDGAHGSRSFRDRAVERDHLERKHARLVADRFVLLALQLVWIRDDQFDLPAAAEVEQRDIQRNARLRVGKLQPDPRVVRDRVGVVLALEDRGVFEPDRLIVVPGGRRDAELDPQLIAQVRARLVHREHGVIAAQSAELCDHRARRVCIVDPDYRLEVRERDALRIADLELAIRRQRELIVWDLARRTDLQEALAIVGDRLGERGQRAGLARGDLVGQIRARHQLDLAPERQRADHRRGADRDHTQIDAIFDLRVRVQCLAFNTVALASRHAVSEKSMVPGS